MTFLATPRAFTAAEFAAYVAKIKWSKGWRPSGVTLHNTGIPNLAQWGRLGIGLEGGKKRVSNLNSYYQHDKGWSSGPHLFVAPDYIWLACDLEARGVHAASFNATTIGVEMVGDYAKDSFTSGQGAQVRDNTVAALAALFKALGVTPTERTLKFHKEDPKTTHDCPGPKVLKPDMLARIGKALAA